MKAPMDMLIDSLGYRNDAGLVMSEEFSSLPNHKHALRAAMNEMSTVAAFGLWTGGNGSLFSSGHARFTPLVYLASVDNEIQAKRVHRSVWSQGLAPYLLIASNDAVWFCQGFEYSASNWETRVKILEASKLDEHIVASALKLVTAQTLRSSLAWRDKAKLADEFVDERLLQSLAELSTLFSADSDSDNAVSPTAINALIARLLYFYFLVDRKFITDDRLQSWGLEGIGIDDDSLWSLADTTALFARLDEVFNGSIFPLPRQHIGTFREEHVNQLRRVLRSGESTDGQLNFFDYNFSTIRTETLSAIYEMFLRNESTDSGKQFGAFYTPPYVADYTLDRLEDQRPFRRGIRVLDPAAGSGVFLVGAYRRIVEASLPKGEMRLPLEDLHDLMMQSIFAIELNETACHVAAFSLYLTMLDYVDPAEVDDYTNWPVLDGKSRLFPPMLALKKRGLANIQVADFFSDEVSGIVCDLIVGNPPWVSATHLRSKGALDYLRNTRAPIGNKQIAELVTWKAYQDHLEKDGLLGLLLPQKSFVNVHSEKFSNFMRSETEIIGISDLAHLRYKLFRRSGAKMIGSEDNSKSKSARQSTAAVFLRKRQPKQDHQFWTFRPLLSVQPRSKRGWLWMVVHDWTQAHWYNQTEIDENAWRRLFTCNQIDRHILKNMDEYVVTGRFYSLGSLRDLVGLNFTINNNKEISPEYVLSANPRSETYWLEQLGIENKRLKQSNGAVPLPIEQLEKSPQGARAFLTGHVVLMPRTCETATYVEKPIATKSFVIGSYNQALDTPLSQEKIVFLKAVAAYMATDTFRYLCFVNGRRMTIDRANIELSAIKSLPWPFGGLGDGKLVDLLEEDKAGRERLVRKALRLGVIHSAAIDEFSTLRKGFSDGATPKEALVSVSKRSLEKYKDAVLSQIDCGKKRYTIKLKCLKNNLIATEVRYVGGVDNGTVTQTENLILSEAILNEAILNYARQGASGITQSRYLWHSREDMTTVLIKPKEHLHWTLDQAFSDADLIVAAAMSGFESIEAA